MERLITNIEKGVLKTNFRRGRKEENKKRRIATNKTIFIIPTDYKRKQPPRTINEISVQEGVPSWKMPMCSRGIEVSWKIVCVRGLDRVSWKMSICSMRK